MKNEPISASLVSEWEKASNEAGKLEDKIVSRIDYIVKLIFKTFNQKLETWYFYGAEEGEMGDLSRAIDSDRVSFIFDLKRHTSFYDANILLKDGSEYNFEEGEFPTRWLYEEFETELIDGKKQYDLAQEVIKSKVKEKALQKKIKMAALTKSLKSKLTKEELALIKNRL